MPRSFRPVRASLAGVGPLLVVEDTSDLPIRLMVVYSYVDAPADLGGDSLARRLEKMQDAAIADLAKQGFEYDGGPFTYTNPLAGTKRSISGGFAVQRTGVVTQATDEGEVGRITYTPDNTPIRNGVVRYLLAARYRKRAWKTEIIVPEDSASGGYIR